MPAKPIVRKWISRYHSSPLYNRVWEVGDPFRLLRIKPVNGYNRYNTEKTATAISAMVTSENTVDDDHEVETTPEPNHRHFDRFSETVPVGQCFLSDFDGTDGVRRRQQTRFAVNRNAFITPLGAEREKFYEQRLLLTLAWFCPEKPVRDDDGVEWHYRWAKPLASELRGGIVLPDIDIYLGRHPISYEELCKETDDRLSHWRYGLVCNCCAGQHRNGERCVACQFAVGFHRCGHPDRATDTLLWRKGSLFGGVLDIQRLLFNLHRKGVPTPVLRQKAEEFIAAGLITQELSDQVLQTIEELRGATRIANVAYDGGGEDDGGGGNSTPDRSGVKLTIEQLRKELANREEKLQAGGEDGVTDQYRVYTHIIQELESNRPLRLMVQASAGLQEGGASMCRGTHFSGIVAHPSTNFPAQS